MRAHAYGSEEKLTLWLESGTSGDVAARGEVSARFDGEKERKRKRPRAKEESAIKKNNEEALWGAAAYFSFGALFEVALVVPLPVPDPPALVLAPPARDVLDVIRAGLVVIEAFLSGEVARAGAAPTFRSEY